MKFTIDYRKAGIEPEVLIPSILTLEDLNATSKELCELQGYEFIPYAELPQGVIENNNRKIKEAKEYNQFYHGSLDPTKIEAAKAARSKTNKLMGF